jgi:hypothetical protein
MIGMLNLFYIKNELLKIADKKMNKKNYFIYSALNIKD